MKVFGIGLNRTGTTSLSAALTILSYDTIHSAKNSYVYSESDGLELLLDEIEKHDAVVGTPLPYFVEEMSDRYPDAKFILTTRDLDSWSASAESHYTKKRSILRKVLYGPKIDAYVSGVFGNSSYDLGFREAFTEYNDKIKQLFSNRDNLLIIDLHEDNAWNSLCHFLDKPIPESPFPHENKRGNISSYIPSFLLRRFKGY